MLFSTKNRNLFCSLKLLILSRTRTKAAWNHSNNGRVRLSQHVSRWIESCWPAWCAFTHRSKKATKPCWDQMKCQYLGDSKADEMMKHFSKENGWQSPWIQWVFNNGYQIGINDVTDDSRLHLADCKSIGILFPPLITNWFTAKQEFFLWMPLVFDHQWAAPCQRSAVFGADDDWKNSKSLD